MTYSNCAKWSCFQGIRQELKIDGYVLEMCLISYSIKQEMTYTAGFKTTGGRSTHSVEHQTILKVSKVKVHIDLKGNFRIMNIILLYYQIIITDYYWYG